MNSLFGFTVKCNIIFLFTHRFPMVSSLQVLGQKLCRHLLGLFCVTVPTLLIDFDLIIFVTFKEEYVTHLLFRLLTNDVRSYAYRYGVPSQSTAVFFT
jgi:hypothetical protein